MGCKCLLLDEIRWWVIFGINFMLDLVLDRIIWLMFFILFVVRFMRGWMFGWGVFVLDKVVIIVIEGIFVMICVDNMVCLCLG